MRIVALLSWYMEPPAWLAATVASVGCFADHLVAVDGAYGLVQGSLAAPRSGREQVEAVAAAADGCGLGYTIHTRPEPWLGNEIEKRSFLFAAGELIADSADDWLFVVDGDEVVTAAPDDLRDQLAASGRDVCAVDYVERSADQPLPEEPSEHRWLPIRQIAHHGARRFFRAGQGLRVVGNHYTYRTADGRYLWGNRDQHRLEPADPLVCFRLEHWHRFRQPARAELAANYYRLRDALGTETPDAAMQLRAELGWSSPLRPLERGDLFCILQQRGTYEWLAHPEDARAYLAAGISVNGELLAVEKIDELPLMNAWQLRAYTSGRAPAAFVEAAAT